MFDGHIPKSKRTYIVNKVGTLKSTESLTDSATGAVDLTDGQIGLISISPNASDTGVKLPLNSFFDGADTDVYAPEIQIVQGTYASASPASDLRPGTKRPYEASAKIEADEKINIVIKAARPETFSIWEVANVAPADLTEYQVRIAFRGAYHDIFKSGGRVAVPAYTPGYTTPDYTQLIADGVLASAAESTDHFIKNLVAQINKNSRGLKNNRPLEHGNELVLALAISKDGGVATGTITVASGNSNITSVTVGGVALVAGTAFTIGASATATATNIAAAINGNATLQAAGVSATSALGVVTVSAAGTAGNAITLADVGTDISVSGATLTGGSGAGISTLSSTVPTGIVTVSYTHLTLPTIYSV